MKKMILMMVMVIASAVIVNAQRTPVKVSDLPKSVSDYVSQSYAGFTIKDAAKVVNNNVATYRVEVTKGTTQETLLFDKDGKFVKKVMAKGGMPGKNPANSKATEHHQTKPANEAAKPVANGQTKPAANNAAKPATVKK